MTVLATSREKNLFFLPTICQWAGECSRYKPLPQMQITAFRSHVVVKSMCPNVRLEYADWGLPGKGYLHSHNLGIFLSRPFRCPLLGLNLNVKMSWRLTVSLWKKKKTVEGCAFRLNLLKDISLLFDPSPLRENTVTSKFHYKRNKALIFCVVAVAKVGL